MKMFLKRAMQFLAPFAAVLLAVAVWAFLTSRATYRSRIMPGEDARVVVIGDSEPACALDPSAADGLVNQAATSLSMEQALYKTIDLLDVAKDRDFTFVLALSPRRLASAMPPMLSTDYESHYAILNYIHLLDSRRPLGDPVRLFRDRVIPDAFHQSTGYRFKKNRKKRAGKSMDVPWGTFTPSPWAHYVDEPEKAERETSDYLSLITGIFEEDPEFSRGAALAHEIMVRVKSSGRRAVLLTTPWHPSLLERIPPETLAAFRRSMSRLAESCGVEWIDDLALRLPDSCFLNQNHLNAVGARPYTESLMKRLKGE